jgi:pimeloyl-ACP methyl ester carboxylesterase
MALEVPEEVAQNFLAEDPGRELRPLLPTLRVPTLVLHGEEDGVSPLEHGRYLADHIPGAQFYVLKGRGHGLFITAAAELARVVHSFIRTGRVT